MFTIIPTDFQKEARVSSVDHAPPPLKGFFREYWASYDAELTNYKERRWRVNDALMSLDPKFGDRGEAHANGLMTLSLPENLRTLEAVNLYLELWGGHPHTANKRFTLNGKGTYALPESGAAEGHCAYTYPSIPLDIGDLVSGTNALQFSCDRGESFWGHFIIDNAALRCFLKDDHPDLAEFDSNKFDPRIRLEQKEQLHVSLELGNTSLPNITAVDFFGHYYGFDDRGEGATGWHGFTQQRVPQNHLGTVQQAPFELGWNVAELDSRNGAVAVKAHIHFDNGLSYQTAAAEITLRRSSATHVELVCCNELPVPFWSRAGETKVANFGLEGIADLTFATLYLKIWDGGEGNVETPFTLNGHPYSVTSGRASHDVVFSKLEVDPAHLQQGENTLTLLSDTEHHGIEVLLPGPCLMLRFNNSERTENVKS